MSTSLNDFFSGCRPDLIDYEQYIILEGLFYFIVFRENFMNIGAIIVRITDQIDGVVRKYSVFGILKVSHGVTFEGYLTSFYQYEHQVCISLTQVNSFIGS